MKSGCLTSLPRSWLWLPGFRVLLLLLAVGAVAGCRPNVYELDDHELSDPSAARAAALERAGDIDGAIAKYNEILTERPDMARMHLAVAFLYDVPQGDYVRALYHYQRYLELRPQTEKRNFIENRIENARQSLVAQYGRDAETLLHEIDKLTVEKQELRTANQRLVTQLEECRAKIAEIEEQLAAKRVEEAPETAIPVPEMPAQPDVPPPLPPVVREPDTPASEYVASRDAEPETALPDAPATVAARDIKYIIQERDTLSALARRFYGDRYQWRRIYDANRARLPNPDVLPVGVTIVIPDVPPDVIP